MVVYFDSSPVWWPGRAACARCLACRWSGCTGREMKWPVWPWGVGFHSRVRRHAGQVSDREYACVVSVPR